MSIRRSSAASRRTCGATGCRRPPAPRVGSGCALLKQYRQLSYEELAFHLEDSASFRAFARLPWGWSPRRSALHQTIGAIRAETWEAVNRTLLASARQEKVEDGSVMRLDSTELVSLFETHADIIVKGKRESSMVTSST